MQEKVSVLVIDAEEIIVASIAKALGRGQVPKYEVIGANTPLDGLKLMRERLFDIIIMDMALPGVDGLEVLRRIKSTNPSVHVIVMSGYSPDRSFLNTVMASADAFLPKPFTYGEIASSISLILPGGG